MPFNFQHFSCLLWNNFYKKKKSNTTLTVGQFQVGSLKRLQETISQVTNPEECKILAIREWLSSDAIPDSKKHVIQQFTTTTTTPHTRYKEFTWMLEFLNLLSSLYSNQLKITI